MGNRKINILLAFACGMAFSVKAQDTVRYTGSVLSNVDYHHGQLSPAIGTRNIQVLRANREHPERADGLGYTYNHAPMLAYHNNTFYLQYLNNPAGEHVPPGQTMLVTSSNGYEWSKPMVLFPAYRVPDGFRKPGREVEAKDLDAVMHQRMGFYKASNGRLLTLAYYAIAMDEKDDPNDGNGIGRVVREIETDGSLGPIYFIRFNHLFSEKNSRYPFFTKAKDKEFRKACEELLANPLMMQQWNEEADRDDPLVPLKKQFKAFSFYHLEDGRTVGLWKHALTSISPDHGKTWQYNPLRAPGFVNSNAKIWGQRTSDGKYATVYNPSEYRWPLAVSTSDKGLEYSSLYLVNGEISPMRYGGNYKSYGPQYVRGILEKNGIPPGGDMWVTYSMNKEDIWVARIPVPVTGKAPAHVNQDFSSGSKENLLKNWNTYSPVWAPVTMEGGALVLKDKDPYDYAKAELVVPSEREFTVQMKIRSRQNDHGKLEIELQDAKGNAAFRLSFDEKGLLTSKSGARYRTIQPYKKDEVLDIRLQVSVADRMCRITVNGVDKGPHILFSPVPAIERVSFRTGEIRRFPHPDTPADNKEDLPNAGDPVPEAAFELLHIKTGGKG